MHRVRHVRLGGPKRINLEIGGHEVTHGQGHILSNDVLMLVALSLQVIRQVSPKLLFGMDARPVPTSTGGPENLMPNTRLSRKSYRLEPAQLDLLERLAKLPIAPPKAESIVAAFEGAHSFAEVYKLEDIRTVLGDLGKLPVESLARLSNSMRQRLATSPG